MVFFINKLWKGQEGYWVLTGKLSTVACQLTNSAKNKWTLWKSTMRAALMVWITSCLWICPYHPSQLLAIINSHRSNLSIRGTSSSAIYKVKLTQRQSMMDRLAVFSAWWISWRRPTRPISRTTCWSSQRFSNVSGPAPPLGGSIHTPGPLAWFRVITPAKRGSRSRSRIWSWKEEILAIQML